MAQLVGYLLYKLEDMNLIPRSHIKKKKKKEARYDDSALIIPLMGGNTHRSLRLRSQPAQSK